MVHGLEAKYTTVQFSYLDADDSRTLSTRRQLGFFAAPEFYLLDGLGRVLVKWVGTVSQEQLEGELVRYLK